MVLSSWNLIYLDSPSLNRHINVSLHFQRLSSLNDGRCTQYKIQSLYDLKRQLKSNRSAMVYFLAHSDRIRGMYIGENININGEILTTLFSNQPLRIPRVVIFNTCYGIQSGLVDACLEAGVEVVFASRQAIRIKEMCGYWEVLLEKEIRSSESLHEDLTISNRDMSVPIDFEAYHN